MKLTDTFTKHVFTNTFLKHIYKPLGNTYIHRYLYETRSQITLGNTITDTFS